MASEMRTIMARLQSMPEARPRKGRPADLRLVIEPGESRYQRKSADLRGRIAALAIDEDDVTVDLTDGD